MADFVSIDDGGNPHIDLSGVKRRQLAAVGAVEGPIIEEGRVVKAPKIKTHDKLKALDMLGRRVKQESGPLAQRLIAVDRPRVAQQRARVLRPK
jgi:hypothetical protein